MNVMPGPLWGAPRYRLHLLRAAMAAASMAIPLEAQAPAWGIHASLGLPLGDLKDTSGFPALALGGQVRLEMNRWTLRPRLDRLVFQSRSEDGAGTTGGASWTRYLQTKVDGWTLGAEGLCRPLPRNPKLQVGAGLHVARWGVDAASTLRLTSGGVTQDIPGATQAHWTKAALSLLATYDLGRHLTFEGRLLTSSYGWEGERIHVAQAGLVWTF